jgi:hypothetical protein
MSGVEHGVTVIDGSSPNQSRSVSPTKKPGEEDKPKRFLNGWTSEQERLMSEWSDYGMCYRWLHDKSEKYFHSKNRWINIPVIILTTLGGTANFGIQSIFTDNASKQYASFAIGGISLFAGLLTTIGNYLRYAQLEESHRVASISWGKFQRQVAVELAMDPNERIDAMDFLKICRAELDRLIEQSPPIPEDAITMFEEQFGKVVELKKPDICGALEHTKIYASTNARLKQLAVEAAMMLKHKKKTLNELLSPQIQASIKGHIDARLQDALEDRKKQLEEEIILKKASAEKEEADMKLALDNRQKRIQEEIDLEKQRVTVEAVIAATDTMKKTTSTLEKKAYFMKNNMQSVIKKSSADLTRSLKTLLQSSSRRPSLPNSPPPTSPPTNSPPTNSPQVVSLLSAFMPSLSLTTPREMQEATQGTVQNATQDAAQGTPQDPTSIIGGDIMSQPPITADVANTDELQSNQIIHPPESHEINIPYQASDEPDYDKI